MTTTIAPTTNAGVEVELAFDFLRTNRRRAKPEESGALGESRHPRRMRHDHGSAHQPQQGGA
jgi:hypothetical protein